ncbi:NAD(P)-dependent alcohol dehydrogenase [Thermopolyspora sp. NPDC052614]|uniref:NAD(P)-dependent alcohol dehydrogenase n=1 Tax=Thermopolyspora sp. NPDC052614 TaxID=3155682 RepID=UPI003426EA79
MRAIIHSRYGTADVLELKDVPRPAVKDGEVLVRVRASSVNFGDMAVLTGVPYLGRLAFGPVRPRHAVLGKDFAGTVEQVGRGVTRLRVGDEVYGEAVAGAFAEWVAVPEAAVTAKPANLTFEQAAAAPIAASTALLCLTRGVQVRPGDKVLINGASGGVGTFTVQIAKAFGAEVTGVCSTRNAELVRSIGADHVVDYTKEDFVRTGRRYDLILDLVGNRSLSDCRRALTPTGTLVLSSGNGNRVVGPIGRLLRARLIFPFVRQSLSAPIASVSRDRLDALRELIEAGKVTPAIDRTYPLSEVPSAMRYFMEEHARAKVVITV